MPEQTPITSSLPDEGYFTGRQGEFLRLKDFLTKNKLVVIEGLAGIGKTALALHYAYQAVADYQAIIWHEVQPGDTTESVLVSIAAQLSDRGHATLLDAVTDPKSNWSARTRTLIGVLRDLHILLILDSFSNCLDDTYHISAGFAPLMDQLLGQTYASRVLLTTKVKAQISPAHLGKYATYELDGLQAQETVPLFMKLGADVGHEATEEEASLVCQAAGGHPFAIKIIVGLLCQGYLLDTLLDQMRGRVVSDYGQFLLDLFYSRLTRGAKRLLEACSVYRRPVSLAAIERLPADPKLMDQLLPYFLLELESHARRYFMHTIVREYAYDKLARDEERRRQVHKAAGDYYASAMGDPLRERDFAAVQRVLEAQHHYRAAEDQAGMVATAAYLADELKPLVRRLYKEGKNDLASNLYRAILAMDEEDAEMHYYYGRLLEKQGSAPEDIERHYHEAVRLAPRVPERQMRYIVWLAKSRKYDEAHKAFNVAVKACGHCDVYVPYAKALRAAGRQNEAAAALREGLKRVPEQSLFQLYTEYSQVLRAQGKLDEAAAALREGLKRVPLESLAHLYLEYSQVLRAQAKLDEAAAALREGLKRVPPTIDLVLAYSDILSALGEFDEAAAILEQGLARAPQNPALSVAYSQVLRAQGKLDEAAAALREGLKRVPLESLAPLYQGYSQVLRAQGKLDEAAAALKEGLKRVPPEYNLFMLYTEYSQVLRAQAKLDEAAAALREGLKRVPPEYNLFMLYMEYSQVLRAQGKLDEAAAALQEGLKRVPHLGKVYLMCAQASLLLDQGDLSGAAKLLDDAIEFAPGSSTPYAYRASLHWSQGELEVARARFEKGISSSPKSGALIYRFYSALLAQTGHPEEARQVLARERSLPATSPEIDHLMSELSAVRPEDIWMAIATEPVEALTEAGALTVTVPDDSVKPSPVAVISPVPVPALPLGPIINILHISDIHRGPNAPTSNRVLLGKLLDDIRRTYSQDNAKLGSDEPRLGPPDIVVVSGDLTQRAAPAEYNLACQFLEGLLELVGGDRRRVVLVPGNHDVNWELSKKSYARATEQEFDEQPNYDEPYRQMVKKERDAKVYWRKIEETYTERFGPFKTFFDDFYRGTTIEHTYSPARDWMYTLYDYSQPCGLVIVGFNTCDEIDHLDRRAFINTDAIFRAENDPAFHAGEGGLLRIAVFHHNIRSVDHQEDFLDPKYLQTLKLHDFDLCLHGHVHTAGIEVFDPTQAKTLPLLGAGSLAAPYQDRPPAAPKGYNLIVINRENGGIFAHTRRHDEDHLIWAADYRWDGKPYIALRPPKSGKAT
jgi:tetratricopeptide (TPR) repeat protein